MEQYANLPALYLSALTLRLINHQLLVVLQQLRLPSGLAFHARCDLRPLLQHVMTRPSTW